MPLIRHFTHQQTAVRPPFDGKLILASYALSLQIFGSCDKIVKDILLVQQPARIMPRRAIFAAPAQVRNGDRAALLKPGESGDRKSVVKGKSGSVRLDPGGRRILKKK